MKKEILETIPISGCISQSKLKWQVAKKMDWYSKQQSSKKSFGFYQNKNFLLDKSYLAAFSRAIGKLKLKKEITITSHGELPIKVETLIEEHATHTNNIIIYEARLEVLPLLLKEKANKSNKSDCEYLFEQSEESQFEHWLEMVASEPQMIHTIESKEILSNILQKVPSIYNLVWEMDLKDLGAITPKEKKDFLDALKALFIWQDSARFSSFPPQMGLLGPVKFLNRIFTENINMQKKYPLLKEKIFKLHDLLESLKDKNIDILKVKSLIKQWGNSRGKSRFKLSNDAILYLEQNYPELCKKYCRYSNKKEDLEWQPKKQQKRKPSKSFFRVDFNEALNRRTLTSSHPFSNIIDHNIYKSPKFISLR